MNKAFSNIYLFIAIASCVLIASITASFIIEKWHWFGRSGAIVTMCGIILSVRPILRITFNAYIKQQSIIDCGTVDGDSSKEIEESREIRLDIQASYTGVVMTMIGTLIWGYGDLLDCLY